MIPLERRYFFDGSGKGQLDRIEWFYDPHTFMNKYGLLERNGKWAVVKNLSTDYISREDYEVITDLFEDRETAVGFIKLLKEK